jgi:hypothetical protein
MRILTGLTVVMCCAMPASAQSIRGQVLDAATAAPLASALIEVRSDSGGTVIRRATDRAGRFFIVLPGPGRYRIGVAAIGYRRRPAEAYDLDAGVRVLEDIRLEATAVQLADLVAQAGNAQCRLSIEASGRVSQVLDAAAEALQIMRATVDAGTLRLRAEWIDRTVLFGRNREVVSADTTRLNQLTWPIQAGAAEALEIRGFALEGGGPGNNGWEFHGPDADVLFSPWFLASHCFDAALSDQGDTLTVAFRPVRIRGDRVDISGRLVFDARTLVLHRMEFEHENLPRGMPSGSVGGAIDFARTADGTWLPVRWGIRAPMGQGPAVVVWSSGGLTTGGRRTVGGTRIVGRREVIGRLLLEDQ